jgi:hypothetical protein
MIATNRLHSLLNRFARVRIQLLKNLPIMDGLQLVVDRQEG